MYTHRANVQSESQSRIFVTLMSLVEGNRQLGTDMAEDLSRLRHDIKKSVAELTRVCQAARSPDTDFGRW